MIGEIEHDDGTKIRTTPVATNGRLYYLTESPTKLWVIEDGAQAESEMSLARRATAYRGETGRADSPVRCRAIDLRKLPKPSDRRTKSVAGPTFCGSRPKEIHEERSHGYEGQAPVALDYYCIAFALLTHERTGPRVVADLSESQ